MDRSSFCLLCVCLFFAIACEIADLLALPKPELVFFSLTEPPFNDPTPTRPNTPRRTQKGPETDPETEPKRTQNAPKRTKTKLLVVGAGGLGGCKGENLV